MSVGWAISSRLFPESLAAPHGSDITPSAALSSSGLAFIQKEALLAMTYSRRSCAPTTIGAEGLNCRVRDGTGCFPFAIVTTRASFYTRVKVRVTP